MSDSLAELSPSTTSGADSLQSGRQDGSGNSTEEMMRDFINLMEDELQMIESQLGSSGGGSADGSSGDGAQPSGLGGGADPGGAADQGGAAGPGDTTGQGSPTDASGMLQPSGSDDLQKASTDASLLSQAKNDIEEVAGDKSPGADSSGRSGQMLGGMSLMQQGFQMIEQAMQKGQTSDLASPKPINATTEL